MGVRTETWESFWARMLRLDFFEEQWDTYRKVADARAEWLIHEFHLDPNRPLLSCACGEGGIELALARRGFRVTAVDKCAPLVHWARDQAAAEGLDVSFLVADLRREQNLPAGNGCVCCFDTLGLLGEEQEQALVRKMGAAVGRGGMLLVDCPKRETQQSNRQWWPLRDGHLLLETRYDKQSAFLVQEPIFIEDDGTRVRLVDPYDDSRGNHTGIQRYIYSAEELTRLVLSTGLPSRAVNHHRPGYTMIAAGELMALEMV